MSSKQRNSSESNHAIEALVGLLREALASSAFRSKSPELMEALRSQGSLARYSDAKRGVVSMSLNHQKRLASQALGSFSVLDELRRSVLSAVSDRGDVADKGRITTRDQLRERVSELERQRTLLLQDLQTLQRAFDLRCRQARQYASKADQPTRSLCEREQREIEASFCLRQFPTTSNVVQFKPE